MTMLGKRAIAMAGTLVRATDNGRRGDPRSAGAALSGGAPRDDTGDVPDARGGRSGAGSVPEKFMEIRPGPMKSPGPAGPNYQQSNSRKGR